MILFQVVKDQPPLAIKKQLKDLKRLVAKDGIENITQVIYFVKTNATVWHW